MATMWSCRGPQANEKPLQGVAVEGNGSYQSQGPSNRLRQANCGFNYGMHEYGRPCVDDCPCDGPSLPFTPIQGASHHETRLCHQSWNSSHTTASTKRRRVDRSCCPALADMSSNLRSSAEMQHHQQRQNYEFQPSQYYTRSVPQRPRGCNSSLLQEDAIMAYNHQNLPGYHAMHGPSTDQNVCPRGLMSAQAHQYNPFDLLSQSPPSSSRDTSSSQLSSLATSQLGQTSTLSAITYFEDDSGMQYLDPMNEQYGNGFGDNQNYTVPSSVITPPPTIFGLDSDHGDNAIPEADGLPIFDSEHLSSYKPGDHCEPRMPSDFKISGGSTFEWPASPNNYEMQATSGGAITPWDDNSLKNQNIGPSESRGSLSHYPPLEDDPVPNGYTQDFASGQMNDPSSFLDPCLPPWKIDSNDQTYGAPDDNFWPTPHTNDRSESSQSEEPSLPSLSKRYRHERSLGYRDEQKDQMLIQWKHEGMSYKEIKIKGGFEEAESTLRGRYRTLTKPKEARVRKPEWQDQDIQNLLAAVSHFDQDKAFERQLRRQRYSPYGRQRPQQEASKVPWKQVADYMARLGSYRFGNATVKKKYMEVTGETQCGGV